MKNILCRILNIETQSTKYFQVIDPDNGVFGILEVGPSQVVAFRFYVITKPIAEGNHAVHYGSSVSSPDVG
jgi:hypothetical protein